MASILLIDDLPELRSMLERALTRAGHEVVSVANGRAALRALENGQFHLVITDIVMPDMDGLELIRAVRKQNAEVRIIGMSGGGRGSAGDYLEFAKSFGASRTLEKPFKLDALIAAVDEVLRP